MRQCSFQRRQLRRRKKSRPCQLFHRPIAAAGRDQSSSRRATIERKLQRSRSPFKRFLFFHERWPHKNENTQVYIVVPEKLRCMFELLQAHALIQPLKDFRMRRLQSHRNFKPACNSVVKVDTSFADKGRMTLDDHPFESGHALRNRRMILQWNGLRVKETSAVIKLDLPRHTKSM